MDTEHMTLVSTEGCHYCAFAREILQRLRQEYPLEVEEVPLESPEGMRLAMRDGIIFQPGIYLNGQLFGYGRLSEEKLRRCLARRALR